MAIRTSWLVALVAACAAVAGFWLAGKLDSSGPELASGTWLPRPRTFADFRLTDQAGKAFSLAELRGHPSLVFFGFTHCPDVCPTTLVKLAQVKKAAALPDLQVLLVSVDPQRDTPALMAQYVKNFDPQFIGLTGNQPVIDKMAAEFGVIVSRVELADGDYTMDHSAVVFLLDDKAREVGVFTPPFNVKQFAQDLRTAQSYLKSP